MNPRELQPPEGFRRLALEDRAVLEPFLLASGRQSCEFAFANLFLWSGTYRPDWCFIGSHLYLLLETEDILMFAPGGARGRACALPCRGLVWPVRYRPGARRHDRELVRGLRRF